MANYVFNSSSSGEKYNAKCLNVSDDSEWTPSAAEYPQDGTIDLSGGTSGRYLDTQWTAPQDTEWTMSGIYNVVMGVSYDMYSIHYKTNDLCDIYLGSSTEELTLSESDKPYTPPTGNWIIEEEPPAIIFPVVGTEFIINGTFDTDFTGWDTISPTPWEIVNQQAYVNEVVGTGTLALDQQGVSAIGLGVVSYYIECDTDNSMRVLIYDKDSNVIQDLTHGIETGTYTLDYVNGVSRFRVLRSAGVPCEWTLDNISVLGDESSSLGDELITTNNWTKTDGSDSISTITPDGSRGFTYNISTPSTATNRPYIIYDTIVGGYGAGKTYEFRINSSSVTVEGSLIAAIYDGGLSYVNVPITTGEISFRHTFANDTILAYFYVNGTAGNLSNWVVTDFSIKEVLSL